MPMLTAWAFFFLLHFLFYCIYFYFYNIKNDSNLMIYYFFYCFFIIQKTTIVSQVKILFLITEIVITRSGIHVKDFCILIKEMLTKFDSLFKEIDDFAGTYPEDKKQLDFWRATKTM